METQPVRALIAVYDRCFTQNGLDTAHDRLCLPFLFKLGGRRQPGQDLFESFESFLQDLGIQIEFDSREEVLQDVTRTIGDNGANGYQTDRELPLVDGTSRRSRRASFNSIYGAEHDSTVASRRRAGSQVSLSSFHNQARPQAADRPLTCTAASPTEDDSRQSSNSQSTSAQLGRGRLKIPGQANGQNNHRKPVPSSERPNHEISRNPSAYRASSVGAHTLGDVEGNIGSRSEMRRIRNHDTSTTTSSDVAQSLYSVRAPERLRRVSETQLYRDADTFQEFRIQAVARNTLQKWHLRATETHATHEDMYRLAVNHDTGILLRQGFEQWRLKFQVVRQAVETERFFTHLENRASRARDLFLLTKAFTHWAECAHESIVLTSIARRHILRVRYFNAWREITAVNELKIRRLTLRRTFGLWQKRHTQVISHDNGAIRHYVTGLLRHVYWHWFWSFCERRAPGWRDGKLRRKWFDYLVLTKRYVIERQQVVTDRFCQGQQRRIIGLWLEKTRTVVWHSRQAELLARRSLTSSSMRSWRLQLIYAPLARQVSNIDDWRVACATFTILVARHSAGRHAVDVNHIRTLRNAWTSWNDRLRWQTMKRQLDDRVVLQALYRWVLAERYILLQRLHDQRIQHKSLSKLFNSWVSLQAWRTVQYDYVLQSRERKHKTSVLELWRTRLRASNQLEELAFHFHAPRVGQDALSAWTSNFKHAEKLKGWAKDAEFYFSTKAALRKWRAALIEVQKRKRRNGYAQVRRRSKMNLAASIINKWRTITVCVNGMRQMATSNDQHRLLNLGTSLFERWMTRSELIVHWNDQVEEHYRRKLSHEHLQIWLGRARVDWGFNERARVYDQTRLARSCADCLRKLRLRILEVRGKGRGLEQTAESFAQMNLKRHLRAILRHWQDQTARMPSPEDLDSPSRGRRSRLDRNVDDDPGNSTRRAENWTTFDIGGWVPSLEAQSNTTPLHGYLSTPSKRAARAKALARVTTTPATPLKTPFGRRLGSQMAIEPRTTPRSGLFGRLGGGFPRRAISDILEDPPASEEMRHARDGGGV